MANIQRVISDLRAATHAPVLGLGSRGLNARIIGDITGLGGPFTPSQMIELQQQIGIFRCMEAKVPIPSELLISVGKRPIPKSSSTFSSGVPKPKSSGAEFFQLGFLRYPDPEPGRCRRTDGKKWRCSRDAIANNKYCDRHIKRGRQRSRKLVETHTSCDAKLVPSATPTPSISSVSGADSLSGLPIAQPNRMLTTEENVNNVTQFAGSPSLPPLPDSVLASDDSLLNLPASSFLENFSFLSSFKIDNEVQNLLDPMASSELSSCCSSPFPESLALSPLNLSDEFASFDKMSWDPVAWPASIGGPLGDVLGNNNITN